MRKRERERDDHGIIRKSRFYHDGGAVEERTKRVEAREGGLRGVDAGRPPTRKKERSWKKSSESERERE